MAFSAETGVHIRVHMYIYIYVKINRYRHVLIGVFGFDSWYTSIGVFMTMARRTKSPPPLTEF